MGSNDFWLILSFLTLPVETQIEKMGGLPKTAGKVYEKGIDNDLLCNPAFNLIEAIHENSQAWRDEFNDNCSEFIKLKKFSTDELFGYSLSEYLGDESWKKLRVLANKTLFEVGLEPLEINGYINFIDYIHDDR